MKTYCFDLDGTLCSITENQEYYKAVPYNEMINIVNKLYNEGNSIKIYTARGMLNGKDFKKLTKNQVNEWGIKYHQLIMNKPSADLYIDDKGCTPNEFFRMMK
jgi:trehalose-6-phosphatase